MAQANRAGYQSAIQSVSSFMDYIPIFGESKLLLEGAFGKDLFTDRQLGGTERVLDIFLGAAGLGIYAAEAKAEGKAVTEGVENSRVGMCGLHSFSADTPVATDANGDSVPIAALKVGDYVLGYDQETGASGTYTVTAVMVHTDPTIVDLTIDGDTLETTPTHFFYTQEYGWVQAGALWQGAHVRKADGSYGIVEASKTVERSQKMYDLTVDTAHTFFVGSDKWLVHNAQRCAVTKVSFGSTDISEEAAIYRMTNKVGSGRNVAVFEFTHSNGVKELIAEASNGQSLHSEQVLDRLLRELNLDGEVTRVYSEFEPCNLRGHYCSNLLATRYPNAEVTYSFDYYDEASRASGRAEKEQVFKSWGLNKLK